MRTHLEFISDAFPAYPGEEEKINPGIWGKRLAEFLVSKLPEYRITPRQFYSEDWGWEIPIENQTFPMFIGCGNQLEEKGNQFLVFIDPSKPQVRRGLFKKVRTVEDIERVADALDKILRSHPEIKELRWWDEKEV